MTRSEFYEQKSKQRAAFYEQKQRERAAFYEQKAKERAAARAERQRAQVKNRVVRFAGHSAGSFGSMILSSYGRVIEIVFCFLLLFGLWTSTAGFNESLTPMTVILQDGRGTTEVGDPELNLPPVFDMGFGYVVDDEGFSTGRYVNLSKVITDLAADTAYEKNMPLIERALRAMKGWAWSALDFEEIDINFTEMLVSFFGKILKLIRTVT